MLNQEIHLVRSAPSARLLSHATRFDRTAGAVLRYGIVALLLLWGVMKFTALEAEGIQPLVEHSPLVSWVYSLFGVRVGSGMIGVVEMTAALLICTRRWKPMVAAIGSLLAVGTFLITLSFLITTPGIWDPANPFGGFIMKDLILLGAALWSTAEALRGVASQAARNSG
ncbi:MAG TPA: DUF417 family protein [Polyangiaceae bacterium]|nr:DUF417 family protein [Polyangiaceae bacterium]